MLSTDGLMLFAAFEGTEQFPFIDGIHFRDQYVGARATEVHKGTSPEAERTGVAAAGG